jgi:hypothetical protein
MLMSRRRLSEVVMQRDVGVEILPWLVYERNI